MGLCKCIVMAMVMELKNGNGGGGKNSPRNKLPDRQQRQRREMIVMLILYNCKLITGETQIYDVYIGLVLKYTTHTQVDICYRECKYI